MSGQGAHTGPAGAHVHDHDSPRGLLSVDDARKKVLSAVRPLAPIELPLTDAYGCVSARDVVATIDLPEFPSSAMDGFAVRADDVAGATPERPVELKVIGRARTSAPSHPSAGSRRRPQATAGRDA